jgi:ABC-type cobalamin/Fe3+-siderophores transport system ATPase subunit
MDGQVFADGRPEEKLSPENLKKLYRICVCIAHSETSVSVFVPTGAR